MPQNLLEHTAPVLVGRQTSSLQGQLAFRIMCEVQRVVSLPLSRRRALVLQFTRVIAAGQCWAPAGKGRLWGDPSPDVVVRVPPAAPGVQSHAYLCSSLLSRTSRGPVPLEHMCPGRLGTQPPGAVTITPLSDATCPLPTLLCKIGCIHLVPLEERGLPIAKSSIGEDCVIFFWNKTVLKVRWGGSCYWWHWENRSKPGLPSIPPTL